MRPSSAVSSPVSTPRRGTSAGTASSLPRYLLSTSAAMTKTRVKSASPASTSMKCGVAGNSTKRVTNQKLPTKQQKKPISNARTVGASYMTPTAAAQAKLKTDTKHPSYTFLKRGSGKGGSVAKQTPKDQSRSTSSMARVKTSDRMQENKQKTSKSVPEIRKKEQCDRKDSDPQVRSASTQAIIDACQSIPEKIIISAETIHKDDDDDNSDMNVVVENRLEKDTGNSDRVSAADEPTLQDKSLANGNEEDRPADDDESVGVELRRSVEHSNLLSQVALQDVDPETDWTDSEFFTVVNETFPSPAKLTTPILETIQEEHSPVICHVDVSNCYKDDSAHKCAVEVAMDQKPFPSGVYVAIIVYDENNKVLYDSRENYSDDFKTPHSTKTVTDTETGIKCTENPAYSNADENLLVAPKEEKKEIKSNIYHIDFMMRQVPATPTGDTDGQDHTDSTSPSVLDDVSNTGKDDQSLTERARQIVDHVMKTVKESGDITKEEGVTQASEEENACELKENRDNQKVDDVMQSTEDNALTEGDANDLTTYVGNASQSKEDMSIKVHEEDLNSLVVEDLLEQSQNGGAEDSNDVHAGNEWFEHLESAGGSGDDTEICSIQTLVDSDERVDTIEHGGHENTTPVEGDWNADLELGAVGNSDDVEVESTREDTFEDKNMSNDVDESIIENHDESLSRSRAVADDEVANEMDRPCEEVSRDDMERASRDVSERVEADETHEMAENSNDTPEIFSNGNLLPSVPSDDHGDAARVDIKPKKKTLKDKLFKKHGKHKSSSDMDTVG